MAREKLAVCWIFYVLLCVAPLYSQTSGAAFLSVDPSPRSYALGSVDAIASSGAQAIGQNPANLGLMANHYEAFTSYQTLLGGAQYGHIAFAVDRPAFLPDVLDVIDAVGLSITHLGVSGITGADVNANPIGTFSANDTAIAFGASSRISSNLNCGADFKLVQSQIGSYSSNWAAAVDLGVTWTFTRHDRPISLAFSADNLGEGLKFVSQTDPLPATIKVAAAMPVWQSGMAMAQLENLLYDGVTQASVGLEYAIKMASLRVGYLYALNTPSNLALADQSSMVQKALGGLSFGIGLHAGSFRFDYAVSQQAVDYGATQRVALTMAWGARGPEQREVRPKPKPKPKPAPDADQSEPTFNPGSDQSAPATNPDRSQVQPSSDQPETEPQPGSNNKSDWILKSMGGDW